MRLPRTAVLIGSAGGGGIIGFLLGKLTPGDIKSLLELFLNGALTFLHEQGAYASFAIVMTLGFGLFAVWAINKLVDGKQSEIDRIVEERDKFQALFINEWKTTKKPPKGNTHDASAD